MPGDGRETGASERKGVGKWRPNRGKGPVPGLRGPVPALRVGPTREAVSGTTAARTPPARSARGPRPAAPAAPRTRRAALVTGGGGRGDPGGLGVGRPGGREAGVRAVAPALALSLLSMPHLPGRQRSASDRCSDRRSPSPGTPLALPQRRHPWASKPQPGSTSLPPQPPTCSPAQLLRAVVPRSHPRGPPPKWRGPARRSPPPLLPFRARDPRPYPSAPPRPRPPDSRKGYDATGSRWRTGRSRPGPVASLQRAPRASPRDAGTCLEE